MEFGTAGEWVSGVGALSAVFVSVLLWRTERKEKLVAQRALATRQREDGEIARTAQAHNVFVWRGEDVENRMIGVSMHNASDLPVFDVVLVGHEAMRGEIFWEASDGTNEVVLPGKGFSVGTPSALESEVWVLFRDANGTDWARDGRGNLSESPNRNAILSAKPPRIRTRGEDR